ncbi:MAG: DUF3606 domain-containing protein [Bacteroidota bacterium]|nr:DUF3606 domain-containing protein [Bacteroidota bacterium]
MILKSKGPQDRSRISLSEKWEVNYWTESFGISKEELEQAVAKVGNSVVKVRKLLNK